MSLLTGIIGVLFLIVCLLLIIVVLLQRGRGGGLSGAFGGAGGHTAFGAKTGDVFTVVTIVLTAVFLVLAVVANYVFVKETYTSNVPEKSPPPIQAPMETGGASTTQPAAKAPAPK